MEGKPDESPAGKSTGLPFPFQPNHSVGSFWRAADASYGLENHTPRPSTSHEGIAGAP
jgi:hypothetical protein